MTWQEVCDNPSLQNLPYRMELNRWGKIEMRRVPPPWHGETIARVGFLLRDLMPGGLVSTITAVDTAENTKVVDLVWISHERRRANASEYSYSPAPEICVEILEPTDTLEDQSHRRQLLMGAGASEFWLCNRQSDMQFFDAGGPLEHSRLCPDFPVKVPRLR